MNRTYGFRLLDDAAYRDKLDRELRRVGYWLGDYHTDEPLLREINIPIEPLGNSPMLCLRITQDAYQDWAYGSLFASADPGIELRDFDFNPRLKHSTSCFDAWLAAIADAVRVVT
ncbi:MAG: hypothetical protein AB8B55_04470 [Mariniblastus sp.]